MTKYDIKRKKVIVRSFLSKMGIIIGEKEPVLNPKQKKMISILRQCVNNPKSDLTVDPILGNCYAECNDYFIILTQTNIDIYGGCGDYTEINYVTGDKLIKFFYHKVSERRIIKETKYKNGGLDKLNDIFVGIKPNI
jgi:hypothetical protein